MGILFQAQQARQPRGKVHAVVELLRDRADRRRDCLREIAIFYGLILPCGKCVGNAFGVLNTFGILIREFVRLRP